MSDPTFGISITRIDNEPRPPVWSDMSVVGIIGTAPDAEASVFPADTPVFLYSDDAATGQTIQAILNTMETGLRNLKADGDRACIIGAVAKCLRHKARHCRARPHSLHGCRRADRGGL